MYARIDAFRLDVSLDLLVSWSMLMIFEQIVLKMETNISEKEPSKKKSIYSNDESQTARAH